ncbi:MAG: hypothetical protein ACKO9B_12825 [Planctomycetota bacterium]
MNEWWSEMSTGLIFGTAGAVYGTLGGLFGVLAGVMVPRGRGKPLVYGLMALLIASGLGGMALGATAVVLGQPGHVWMWPLLLGAMMLFSILPGGLGIHHAYRQAERRRLDAAELRQSA